MQLQIEYLPFTSLALYTLIVYPSYTQRCYHCLARRAKALEFSSSVTFISNTIVPKRHGLLLIALTYLLPVLTGLTLHLMGADVL